MEIRGRYVCRDTRLFGDLRNIHVAGQKGNPRARGDFRLAGSSGAGAVCRIVRRAVTRYEAPELAAVRDAGLHDVTGDVSLVGPIVPATSCDGALQKHPHDCW